MNVDYMGKRAILAFYLFLLILGACQQEEDEIIQPTDKVFTSESILANLLKRISLKDGSFDNILDKSSCSSFVLPVTVYANGEELVIKVKDDLKLIERIFDQSDSDDDTLVYVFPITLILADYSQVVIYNLGELNTIKDQCIEGGADDDIECTDFIYPLKFKIYNTGTQLQKTITINSDEALFRFINSLTDEDLASIHFPVTVSLYDGSEIVISSQDELEEYIENSTGDCDEDDDNDFGDDDVDDSGLITVLTDGQWRIIYFLDETDQTGNFEGMIFTFSPNNIIVVAKDTALTYGDWKTYGDEGYLELEIKFSTETTLNEISEDWLVVEFSSSIIKLKNTKDNGALRILTLQKL